jgi:hypothetical protein
MTNPSQAGPSDRQPDRPVGPALVTLAWLWVALPFTYGVWQLVNKITQLFGT